MEKLNYSITSNENQTNQLRISSNSIKTQPFNIRNPNDEESRKKNISESLIRTGTETLNVIQLIKNC